MIETGGKIQKII